MCPDNSEQWKMAMAKPFRIRKVNIMPKPG